MGVHPVAAAAATFFIVAALSVRLGCSFSTHSPVAANADT